MSLNVIVMAAIVLLIMIVLTIAFTSRFSTFTQGVDECRNKGGEPMSRSDCSEEGGLIVANLDDEDGEDLVCCSTGS